MVSFRNQFLGVAVSSLLLATGSALAHDRDEDNDDPDAVGLSLFFQNGSAPPLTLIGDAPRFLQEVDIGASLVTSSDEGITPLSQAGDFANLDWHGVEMVEESWQARRGKAASFAPVAVGGDQANAAQGRRR